MYRDTRVKADRTADSYYIINRNLLFCIGLWPYQPFAFRCISITLMTIILASSVVFQFTIFITKEYNLQLLLKILAYSIPWLSYMLRYNVLCLNTEKMRGLVERVRFDWNELNNTREIQIIKKYSAIGRFVTLVTTLSIYLCVFGFILSQLVTNYVLDLTTANESRVRQLPAEGECFIDQQKYFTVLLLYTFVAVICGITTVIAIETLFMSYTQHACGLFEIANCRIKRALYKGMAQNIISVAEKNSIICQGITRAVDIHRKAIESREYVIIFMHNYSSYHLRFIEMSKENFKWVYFISLPLTVLSLSINLYRLSWLITTEDHQDTVTTFLFVLGHFWYMFFCNYIGQEVIDHSSNIFYKTYNVQWYIAPIKAQKLLLLVMQRSLRHCTIMIGGLFIPSLEGYATLISMSLSYFMVIYSVQ